MLPNFADVRLPYLAIFHQKRLSRAPSCRVLPNPGNALRKVENTI